MRDDDRNNAHAPAHRKARRPNLSTLARGAFSHSGVSDPDRIDIPFGIYSVKGCTAKLGA